jgi:DNA-directed RNA polymerase subunit omega
LFKKSYQSIFIGKHGGMVAKRVRQIREGSDYLVSSPKNEDIVVALREVAAGKIIKVKSEEKEEQKA